MCALYNKILPISLTILPLPTARGVQSKKPNPTQPSQTHHLTSVDVTSAQRMPAGTRGYFFN